MSRSKTPLRYLVIPLVLIVVMVGALIALAQETTYTVQRGDTLDTIAQRYDVSLDALMTANGLTLGSMLFPGDTLFIPIDAPAYGVMLLDEANQGGGGEDGIAFLLQMGDSLDLLAALYNVDVACLIEFNNVAYPQLLQAGEIIIIPTNCPPYAGLSTAVPGALRGFEVNAGLNLTRPGLPEGDARSGRQLPATSAPAAPTQEQAVTEQPQAFATLESNATLPVPVTATPVATAQG